ncbi:MAG: hypothetical protein SH857_09060, partial [Chitinophagales bacterium]|nr:hypothetical protein [Chitinophagales bacterium]
TICQGGSYFAGGANQTTAGTYRDTLVAANGCDSIITTELNILNNFVTNTSATICPGDSFFVAGAWQTAGGFYSDTLVGPNGCDSIIITDLGLLNAGIANLSSSICAGDSFFVGGDWQTTAGQYSDTLIGANGCDSIVLTNLTVLNQFNTTITSDICTGDSLFAGGAWQFTSGIYVDTFTSARGCDSIVATNLSVQNSLLTNISVSVCAGDSFFAGGAWQFAAGIYVDTLASSAGCDSIVITDLQIINDQINSVSTSICLGDSLFVGSAWQTTTGIYYDTVTTSGGCEDITITDLSVINTIISNVSAVICPGDSFFAGGNWQTQTGLYFDTLTAAAGCDSVVITDLGLSNPVLTTISLSICTGDSAFAGGANQTTTGIYFDTLAATNGCDSIVTTNLNVLSNFITTITASICAGDSFFVGGAWQTVNGIYFDTLTAATGCDSIVETNLAVINSFLTNISQSICSGDSFFVDGAWQTASGIYTDSLISTGGCDSVVVTDLNITSSITVNVFALICNGDSLFVGGGWQTTSGIYTDSFISSGGCDSIVITNLNIESGLIVNALAVICQGDSIFAGGAWQTTQGVYSDTVLSSSGCDSLITITELSVFNSSSTTISLSICTGDSVFAGGNWQFLSGIYTDTFISANGCDSILITNITVLNSLIFNVSASICTGDSFFAEGTWQTSSGIYSDTLQSAAGCDSIINTNLLVANAIIANATATIAPEIPSLLEETGKLLQEFMQILSSHHPAVTAFCLPI